MIGEKKYAIFRSLMGLGRDPGQIQNKSRLWPNFMENRPGMGSGKNKGNPYQMEDNKAPPSAAPQGGARFARAPRGLLFLYFCSLFLFRLLAEILFFLDFCRQNGLLTGLGPWALERSD